ncbi:helix-turn-helix domain-containing protein [Rothia sp. AR01]|uniref:Glycerol operon regulatory protein n=1 Tax=Rothia santali TaxID=2949643 RepID=A0A9X2HHF7_9MICC|nr:IclR family transcriptional regulator C-terminal domain-containing protein [Rothia santali]MCP3424938.1 helix-turn-helix domain-containing protein [Rothia santali]
MTDAYVQSLARGLAVLRAFDAEHVQMTLAEVARRTDLTRATARRFLHTLVELGYVLSEGGTFRLSPSVLSIGYAYLSGLSLPELAYPHLRELSARVGESSSMSVLAGDDIVYVARVPARRIMAVTINVGTTFPAFATSMGRVLLAGLPPAELERYLARQRPEAITDRTLTDAAQISERIEQARRCGWTLVDQELEIGLRSVAAPVVDAAGRTIAAINVSMRVGSPTASTDSISSSIVPRLREAALRIGHSYRAGGGALG